jgi:hypothetical protein
LEPKTPTQYLPAYQPNRWQFITEIFIAVEKNIDGSYRVAVRQLFPMRLWNLGRKMPRRFPARPVENSLPFI